MSNEEVPSKKCYWHELTDAQIRQLMEDKLSISDIKNTYSPPEWCDDANALNGQFGCWSLMDLYERRHLVSEDYCCICIAYKPTEK